MKIRSRMCKTVLFLCVWQTWMIYFFAYVRSICVVYRRFYPHLFASYLIKINDRGAKVNKYVSFYGHIVDEKSSNFSLSFVSQIHDYDTKSTYLQHLNTCTFRINIRRFCPTVIGCYYWNDIPITLREKPTRKLFFFKSSFCVSLFSASINIFLWLCTIDIFVVKSVILIPSLMYASLLFYCIKNKMLFGVKGI